MGDVVPLPGKAEPCRGNEKGSARYIALRTWIGERNAKGEPLIGADDPIFEYADRAGIPHEWLRLCWKEFRARHIDTDKRYADWRKAFRNCVRSNWYRLWTVNGEGQMMLTGQGKIAQRVHASGRR